MRRIGGLAGALAAVAVLCGGPAGAATLKADYRLEGSRSSAVSGAPDLVDLAPGNAFATETVGGAARPVLSFPKGSGVSLATAGLVDPRSFSVVMVLRLNEVSGYRRLLDFSGGTSDSGLYVLNGGVRLFGSGGAYTLATPVAANAYVQVMFVSGDNLDGTQWTEAWVDGELAAFSDAAGASFGLASGILRFFRDDGPFGGEQSAGAVACVALYDDVLTLDEIDVLAADPARCAAAPPSPPVPSPPVPSSPPAPPAPAAPPPPPSPSAPFRATTYVGRTSQGLPISFTVAETWVDSVYFRWRARCADGRVRTRGMVLRAARIRDDRFSVAAVLSSGARGRVSGGFRGASASGTLSRRGRTASGVACRVRNVRWSAQIV